MLILKLLINGRLYFRDKNLALHLEKGATILIEIMKQNSMCAKGLHIFLFLHVLLCKNNFVIQRVVYDELVALLLFKANPGYGIAKEQKLNERNKSSQAKVKGGIKA